MSERPVGNIAGEFPAAFLQDDRLCREDPFSAGYGRCPSPHHCLRLAHAIRSRWEAASPSIRGGDRLAGRPPGERGIGGFGFGSGIEWHPDVADALVRKYPEREGVIRAVSDFWAGLRPGTRVSLPADEERLNGLNVYWAGWGGHTVLGFTSLLAGGLRGLRSRVSAFNSGECDPAKQAFRESLTVICDGIGAYARNHAVRARQLARECSEPGERRALEELAARCDRVPVEGARTFAEAIQSFWFVHVLDGCDSPGRIDQFLAPFYERDVRAGRLDRDGALVWIEELWRRFEEHRSWNVCVGGLTAEGEDGTNDLTFLCLEAMRRARTRAPNLSLRLHRGSSPEVRREAVRVLATGCGMPALYNDDVIVPALTALGIPSAEARDYALNGCSQIDITGLSHMGLEDGELNLLKCLELALNDGVDPLTGLRAGPATGDASRFGDFDAVVRALHRQIEYGTRRMVRAANAVQKAHAATSPNLLRSLLVDDCAARGVDFKSGGARYNHGQILTQGIANTADSLAVLRHAVFEEGFTTLAEVLEHLRGNFPDEAFRRRLLAGAPRYGNGDPGADEPARQTVEHFFRHLRRFRTWRGGVYTGGSIVFTRGVEFGRHVGATPDGRRSGEPLADSVGPAQGRDACGPTAMFRSVASAPQELAGSAYVLNVKFRPEILGGTPDRVEALLRTYFDLGGQQVQVNVVDAETLRRARGNPEAYAGLVVRVGGYSEYFVRLPKELQDDVIARTEHGAGEVG